MQGMRVNDETSCGVLEARVAESAELPAGRRSPLRRAARRVLLGMAGRAARAYIAGERLEDGLRVARQHAAAGRMYTLGYFNEDDESPDDVARHYEQTLSALARTNGYISIKLPAIGFSQSLLETSAIQARELGVRLHFDAMWPGSVSQTMEMIDGLIASGNCGRLGMALPGRWRRSPDDARWASERGIRVRVVKGQWPDPMDPHRDLRGGFMEVIRALTGRAVHVAVASHDLPLADEATDVLCKAGTPCEVELLHGLPMNPVLAMAKQKGLGVRIYVPFGRGHLPYALSQVVRRPRLAWWLFKDLTGMAAVGRYLSSLGHR